MSHTFTSRTKEKRGAVVHAWDPLREAEAEGCKFKVSLEWHDSTREGERKRKKKQNINLPKELNYWNINLKNMNLIP